LAGKPTIAQSFHPFNGRNRSSQLASRHPAANQPASQPASQSPANYIKIIVIRYHNPTNKPAANQPASLLPPN
jgi:hypothetical protein